MNTLFQEESERDGWNCAPLHPAMLCCYHLTDQWLSKTIAQWGGYAEVAPVFRTNLDPAMEMICTGTGKMQDCDLKWDGLPAIIHYQAWEYQQKTEFDVLGEVHKWSLDKEVRKGYCCYVSLGND